MILAVTTNEIASQYYIMENQVHIKKGLHTLGIWQTIVLLFNKRTKSYPLHEW